MITVKTDLQIRFNDIDLAGHVHNVEYFNYFEIGRIDFFSKIVSRDWDWKKKGILVARNEGDYLKSVKFNDTVFVETTCEDVGKKSITLTYRIFRENKDGVKELCTKGRSILVCLDFDTNESVDVFDEWKDPLLKD
jgi:acyl-CoA thioester hydrolase